MFQAVISGTNVLASENEQVSSDNSESFIQPRIDSVETEEGIPVLTLDSSEEMLPFANSTEDSKLMSEPEVIEESHSDLARTLRYQLSPEVVNYQANSKGYLKIPVYNNPNDYQTTHPSVLYFANGWNGYKFWMGHTPYEYNNELLENPSIAASNDGINWEVPTGVVNPLEATDGWDMHYSDPHLVFVNGKIEYWYRKKTRFNLPDAEMIVRKISSDGINWSAEEILYTRANTGADLLSPVVHYEDGKYQIWFSNFYQNKFEYYESTTGTNWTKIRDINFPVHPEGLKPWHMDIIKTGNVYELYYSAGLNDYCTRMSYATSTDNINYTFVDDIMMNMPNNFDETRIYRPSIVNIGDIRYLYYAGSDRVDKWYIGLSIGTPSDPTNFTGYDFTIPVNYTVTFDYGGGDKKTVEVVSGSLVEQPATPTKEGYTFAGWYQDAELTTPFNFSTPIKKNMTLYAKWQANEETVQSKEIQTIPYQTERKADLTLPVGQEVIEQVGVLGEKTITYETKYIAGKEVSRTVLSEEITKNPVNEIIRVGAKEKKVGWVFENGNWYYFDSNGEMKTNWLNLDNQWYYLDSNGVMQVGWIKLGTQWYYLNPSGVMQVGWLSQGGHWYYLNPSGAMHVGWLKLGNNWYYLSSSGAMRIGWLQLGNQWFYLNPGGDMQVGWLKLGNSWYYLNLGGDMQVGWLKLGNQWYYLSSSGVMVTGTQYINGVWYTFASSGALQ